MSDAHDLKVLARRRDVAQLYLQGYKQVELAQKHRVSQAQISLDLKWIRAEWIKESTLAFNERLARELARIDALEIEAWNGYRRSIGTKERTLTEKTEGLMANTRAQLQKEQLLGDPRWLDQVKWCIEQRLKIFGVYAPTKIAPTDPTGQNEWTGKSDSELVTELQRIMDAAAARAGAGDSSGVEKAESGRTVPD